MSNGNPPLGGDAFGTLAPFQPRFLAHVERAGGVVYQFPGKGAFGHGDIIGHIVQRVKPPMSKDNRTPWLHSADMAGMSDEQLFNEALCARTHKLRNDRGWTAEQMATALGVPPDRYRKYEYRSPLPHYLIERFALIVGRDVEYILTGKSAQIRGFGPKNRRKSA